MFDLNICLIYLMSKMKNPEEKIIDAAKDLFKVKGFEGTKTREITDKAGVNLAMLNYYFRSKVKLFELIMFGTMSNFINDMLTTFKDEETSLENKVKRFVSNYIELLKKEPELPIFLLNEMHRNPEKVLQRISPERKIINTHFFEQLSELTRPKSVAITEKQFIINMISMTIFPFIGKPLIKSITETEEKEFNQILEERKELIPKWLMSFLQ